MKFVVVLSFLWGALASGGFAQSGDPNRAQNLRECLDGFGICDHSLLTSTQAKQIAKLSALPPQGRVSSGRATRGRDRQR